MGKKIVIGTIVAVILLILISGISLVSFFGVKESIIPQYCYRSEPINTVGTFRCPSDSSGCQVTIQLECKTVTDEQPIVLSRTDDTDYGKGWIVTRTQYGNLESWNFETKVTQTSINIIDTVILPLDKVGYYSLITTQNRRVLFVPDCSAGVATCGKWFRYGEGGAGNTNPEPQSNCATYEVCSGMMDAYTCSQKSSGDVILSISGSQTTQWTKTNSASMKAGQTINWNGKITGTISYQMESECRQNKVNAFDSNSYYECKMNTHGCGILDDKLSYCDTGQVYIEKEQRCSVPYQSSITSTKKAYAIGERINGEVQITGTSQVSNIPIQVCISSLADVVQNCQSVSTSASGKATYSLNPISSVAGYNIIATINHPQGSSKSEVLRINVVDPLSFYLFTKSPRQNTGEVSIYAVVTDSGGNPKTDVSFDFAGSVCGTQAHTGIEYEYLTTSDRGAEYRIYTDVSAPCQFQFRVIVVDSTGYRSSPAVQAVTVEKAIVIIEPLNENQLHNKVEGLYTYEFLILNKDRQLFTPESIVVKVQERGGCYTGEFCTSQGSSYFGQSIPAITLTESSVGKYRFSHTFQSGLNYLFITADDSNLATTTYDTSLYFMQKENVGVGKVGGLDGKILVYGAIAMILAFGFFIFRKKKRRKQ